MMGGCKRAAPLGILWEVHSDRRSDESCSTGRGTDRRTGASAQGLTASGLTKLKGSQVGQKGTEELLQATPQLEGLATGGSSKDSALTFSGVMEGIGFDGGRVTPGPAEAPLTPFGKG